MKMSLTTDGLREYVKRQCQYYFPDDSTCYEASKTEIAYEEALFRTEECFQHITLRNYTDENGAVFSLFTPTSIRSFCIFTRIHYGKRPKMKTLLAV